MFEKMYQWMSENSEVFVGAVMCAVIFLLNHKKEGSCMDKITGAVLCSLFSTGLYYGIICFVPSLPPVAAVAIGSLVGFLGVDECKAIIIRRIKKLLDSEDKE